MLKPFAKKNEALILWNIHKQGSQIFPSNYMDCTALQQYFISAMSAYDVNYSKNIDLKLKALCEANGVKFKK